jgi:tRNA(Arg) A34 adenosine deaminase TadA
MDDTDRRHLTRCVDLAEAALDGGNAPFGSVLIDAGGRVVAEEQNRIGGGDSTMHPEFELARWAVANMTPAERAAATMYTSGEHCPMCAAAHAWVGLGRIVYAGSSAQLVEWRSAAGGRSLPVNPLPIQAVAPGLKVEGPEPSLSERLKALHIRRVMDELAATKRGQ